MTLVTLSWQFEYTHCRQELLRIIQQIVRLLGLLMQLLGRLLAASLDMLRAIQQRLSRLCLRL